MNKVRPAFSDYALLVTLAAIYGGSFMLTKVAVVEIPAATLVAMRLGIAAVIFGAAMFWVGQRLPGPGKIWLIILAAALFGNALPFYLISWGQESVDAGLAAILMATMPLMTIVIAHFFTNDEKLTRWKLAGFILGLLGVAVMIGIDKLGTLGQETIRQYAIIGGALCYAINGIVSKSLIHLPRLAMVAALMVLSTLMILPVALLNDGTIALLGAQGVSGKALASAIVLGILPTALGTMMIFVIITRQGASFLSQINFMVPVFGVLWGILFLAEILPANGAIALALILAGVAIARIQSNSVQQKEPMS
ncbi:MAG: DMT family transporter [Rhizobiaceae bacterium]|nr:DMT family transporter [Rhizobiaceae bacterium]